MSEKTQTDKTIEDFGDQWTRYTENGGFYASQDMFRDIVGPLLAVESLDGARCAEIGAGTGRITNMLLRCGVAHVLAVEPSRASTVLRDNTAVVGDRVTVQQARGDDFVGNDLDYIFSIGVLHHIPDPAPTVRRMREALKPGGQVLIWLYGREGNTAYLSIMEPLRAITQRLPVAANGTLSWLMYIPLALYVELCRWLPLPMRSYMREVLAPLSGRDARLVIVDQLNPTWAKYYRGGEARQLLEDAGFTDVQLYHRHGYSWTVLGTRTLD